MRPCKRRSPDRLSALPWGEQMRNGELVHIPDVEVEGAMLPGICGTWHGCAASAAYSVCRLLRDRAPIGFISCDTR